MSRSRARRGVVVACLLACGLGHEVARADGDPTDAAEAVGDREEDAGVTPEARDETERTERARRLFDEASRLRDAGEYQEAAERLRRAIALKETPGLHFHLADVLEALGDYAGALAEYQRARKAIDAGQPAPDVERLLSPSVARVRAAMREAEKTSETGTEPGPVGGAEPRGSDPSGPEPDGPVVATEPEGAAERGSAEDPEAETGAAFGAREVVLASEAGVAILAVGFGILQTLEAGRAADRIDTNRDEIEAIAGPDPGACRAPANELSIPCRDLSTAIDDRNEAELLAASGYVVGGAMTLSFFATLLLWESPSEEGARLNVAPAPGGMRWTLSGRF